MWNCARRSNGLKWQRLLCVAAFAALLAPSTALAGRRAFLWAWDTEVQPERGIEIEQWITERIFSTPTDLTQVWWAPVIGLSDRVELALPGEWSHHQDSDKITFDWYGAELRWRLASPDPMESGKLVPLIRVAAHRLARSRTDFRLEATAVLAWDPHQRVHLVGNLGVQQLISGDETVAPFSLAASYAATSDLKLGVELFGDYFAITNVAAHRSLAMIGPSFGWTFGRMWLTAGALVGITDSAPQAMPRLLWAIQW